jgi:hypothetical protein
MSELLRISAQHEATDPRDHIYALLGVAKDISIELDYSMPVDLVFCSAMASTLMSDKNLDLLIHAPQGKDSIVPSWCIDFSVRNWNSGPTRKLSPGIGEGTGVTTGREKSTIRYDTDKKTLTLDGCEVGRIAKLAAFKLDEDDWEAAMFLPNIAISLYMHVFKFANIARQFLSRRLGEEMTAQSLTDGDAWKAAVGGTEFSEFMAALREEDHPRGWAFFGDWAKSWARDIFDTSYLASIPSRRTRNSFDYIGIESLNQLASYSDNTFLFVTDSGYMGLAVHPIQEGDIVCALYGCRLPAVIRPQQDGSFKVISFTYTHEIMKGELFKDVEVKDKIFVLS